MSLAVFYGGTFDPVHAGHLAVARAARDFLDADVVLLPAGDPPHRAAPGADAGHRAAMLALAVAGEAGLSVDTREFERPGPSYSVDTLAALRTERGPKAPLAWVLGADAFRGLPGWHRWRELLDLAHLVVAVRPGHGLDDLPPALAGAGAGRWRESPAELRRAPAGGWLPLAMPAHPASATALRARLAAGGDTGDWLPAPVAAYIARHGLYRGGQGDRGV